MTGRFYLISLMQGRIFLEENYPVGPFGTEVCLD